MKLRGFCVRLRNILGLEEGIKVALGLERSKKEKLDNQQQNTAEEHQRKIKRRKG